MLVTEFWTMEKHRKRLLECEPTADEPSPKRVNVVSVENFRKELKDADAVKWLKSFISFTQQEHDRDFAKEYLEEGGSVQEILLILDKSAKGDLTTALPVFRVLHLILLSVKDSSSEYYAAAEDGVKYMLGSFTSTIEAMINFNSNKHRKTVLKLLSTIVTLFPFCARDILNFIPTSPNVINEFLAPSPAKDSVRKWFILFILSFIVGGEYTYIRSIMNMKGLLGNIINDMKFDEVYTVNIFLSVLKEKVLENLKVPKALKLKVFNTQVVLALFELYNWKGPKNVNVNLLNKKKGTKEKEVDPADKDLVTESIQGFLFVLCTSTKYGIAFADTTLGSSGEHKNNLLLTVIQSLSDPWENEKMAQVLIGMVVSCPDLFKSTIAKMDSALKPRDSKKWNKLLKFVENLLVSISPREILKEALKVSEIDLVRQAKEFCTPTVLIRHMSLGVRNFKCFPVFYYSMRVLSLLWKKANEVIEDFKEYSKLKSTLIFSFHNCFIESHEITDIWKIICENPLPSSLNIHKEQFLNVILDYLEMIAKCDKDALGSPSHLAGEMLQYLEACKSDLADVNQKNIRNRVFHLVIEVDPMSFTPDNVLFRNAVNSLIDTENKLPLESLTKLILSTGVFENNEAEIDVWFACYFHHIHEYTDVIPNFLIDCISSLYLKEIDLSKNFTESSSKQKSVLTELMNIETSELMKKKWVNPLAESPTPMFIQSLEMIKAMKNTPNTCAKISDIEHYLNEVAFRLYHYYNNSHTILKFCQNDKIQLNVSILKYMEDYNQLDILNNDSGFLSTAEKELLPWILNETKKLQLENIFKLNEDSLLSLFLTFKMVTSYLIYKVNSNLLTTKDVARMLKFFSFFINCEGSSEENCGLNSSNILSYDVKNLNNFRKKCINALFTVPLQRRFKVYESENESDINFTNLIASIIRIIHKRDISNLTVFNSWKQTFLENMKDNFEDRLLNVMDRIEPFLDCFSYAPSEIYDVLKKCCSVADVSVFVCEGSVKMATLVFTRFVKMYSNYSELNADIIGQLRNIIQCMMKEGINNTEVIDECFMYIVQKRPKTLNFIDNEFIEYFLQRENFDQYSVSFGKVLLNDPNKVEHFLKFARENFKSFKNKRGVVSLMAALILEEDSKFLALLRSGHFYVYWKEGEFLKVKNSNFSRLMKRIFKKYKDEICFINPENRSFMLKHSKFFSLLFDKFLDKDHISVWKDRIADGFFEPALIHRAILKTSDQDLLQTYIRGLLNIMSNALTEAENGVCEESIWSEYNQYLIGFIDAKQEFSFNIVTDSAIWKDFVRLSLRICFNFPQCPSFLRAVRLLIELLYKPGENSSDIMKIFEMMISHSQFLNVMLQRQHLKDELVKLYYCLITRNNQVLSSKHIPLLLASYSASLSESDITLLNIIKFYESHDISMNEYEPIVWGDLAVSHYSIKSNVGVSLWHRINMLNILDFIDSKRLEISLVKFPIYRNPQDDNNITYNDMVYDPCFLLSVFASLLSPGAVTYCLPFVQRGCFAYTLCSLSSTSKEIRAMASVVLSRFHTHLELVQNMKMKTVWLHFNNCLRYGIDDISQEPLPSVFTLFLAKASMGIAGEPDEMYSALRNFLLAKPIFRTNCIPEFLPLFHSSDVYYQKQRRWILEVLRDGFKHSVDLKLLFQTMGPKIILSNFKSHFCGRETKVLILEMLIRMMKLQRSKLLVTEYGLLTWLHCICLSCDRELLSPFLRLMSAVSNSCRSIFLRKGREKRNHLYHTQILNILIRIMPIMAVCNSADNLEIYLRIILDCLMIKFKSKKNNWCKLNVDKLYEICEIIMKIIGDPCLFEKYSGNKYYIRFEESISSLEQIYKCIALLWEIIVTRSK